MNGQNDPRPGVLPAAQGPRTIREVLAHPASSPAVLDAALWAAVSLPVLLGMMLPPAPSEPGWWAQGAGLALMAAAVAAGRAWPLAPLLTTTALIAVHGNFVFGLPVMAYLTGRRMARARPVLWAFTAVFAVGTTLNIVRGIDVTTWFPLTIWLVLLGVLPWLVGRYWRQYQELVHAGWERAERLEQQQRIVAERERLRERARIAQDMHDSLGHELALIAVRAGALQVAPGLDERHRRAAAELRAGAAEATEHLREIIGVLREGTWSATGPDSTPGPGFGLGHAGEPAAPTRPVHESITELVERAHASGIPVRLLTGPAQAPETQAPDTSAPETPEPGTPHTPEPEPEPAPMVTLAAHRVVQEALTNATKHAPGAPITVRLTRTPGGLTVSITNRPPPTTTPPPAPTAGTGGGHGLAGLAERVRLAGGTLRTGPTTDGGFQVHAHLPDVPPGTPPPPPTTAQHPPTGPTPPPRTQTESARRLARERRQVRRGLVTAIAVPTGLVAALSAVMVGYYAFVTLNSVLPPSQYAALRPGTEQATVQRTLPPKELISAETRRNEYPEPPGTRCRYYRADANILGLGTVYRLCFTGGRLAHKDALRPPRPTPE
ncbi:histidine kinase [Actinomadura viridis]|uniref:histidine kinase n=1 Tax=Actinomadura viridis TaxID=58110 RepID=A0A931DLE9_9ACTN|nr:histidine kinase [Actinomadura viridis]MBG6089711.1 signal transduction histidine kinase [Actinomadura viridis]